MVFSTTTNEMDHRSLPYAQFQHSFWKTPPRNVCCVTFIVHITDPTVVVVFLSIHHQPTKTWFKLAVMECETMELPIKLQISCYAHLGHPKSFSLFALVTSQPKGVYVSPTVRLVYMSSHFAYCYI